MNTAQTFLTLAIGIVVGVGLTAAAVATAQSNTAVKAAEAQARRNAAAAVELYSKETVGINGHNVNILQDNKRGVVCYITESSGSYRTTSSSCVRFR